MKPEEKSLLELISDYISCAKYSCELLREIYSGNESLLYAYKVLKAIPKEGTIGNVYYNFHGRGCYFEYENDSIDVDFGVDGRRVDGFDIFRLEGFLKHRISKFSILVNPKILNDAFSSLIKKKIIKKHPQEIEGHLYYLSNSI